MKKTILSYFALLLCSAVLAQTPQLMSYQAVVRNGSNQLLANAPAGMRLSILQGSATGTAVYSETHSVTTNAQGLATLSIGGGTPQNGTFAGINWANGPFFLKAETDSAGGSNYSITSTSQLMSVPYALYAERSATPGPQGPQGVQGPQGPGASCYSCPTMVSQIYTQTEQNKTGPNGNYNDIGIYAAVEYCINLVEGGFSDWRLPQLAEIEYLREVRDVSIPIDQNCYPCIWTKTATPNGSVYYYNNISYFSASRKTGLEFNIKGKVICVR